jgi:uncharacterized protein (PEP-CTERM system associated)
VPRGHTDTGMGMATDTTHSRVSIPWALAGFAFFHVLTASAQTVPGGPYPYESASPAQAAAPEPLQAGPEADLPRAPTRLRPWRVVPRILGSETYSDNVARVPASAAESGWISSIAPGIRAEGVAPRAQGYLDFQRTQYVYHRHSELDTSENILNSFGKVELLENWLFVDAVGRIAQVNTSPFASSATETPGFNPDRTETSVIQLSPHVRGLLGGQAFYQLRFNAAASHASGEVVPDTTSRQWLGRIQNVPGGHAFGWSLDGSQLVVRNAAINEKRDSRVRASLSYAPHSSVRVAAYGGVEATDLNGPEQQRSRTPGFGVEWSPSARTEVAAVAEQRFFGTGHKVLFTHRTPRMALKFVDDKDVSTLAGRLASGGQSSMFNLMADLLAAGVPDPAMRSDAVRERIERTGAVQAAPASNGFLTTQPTLLARQELSLALLGRANTVTLIGNRSEYHAFASDVGVVGAPGSVPDVRQQGYSVSWAHQLSPRSAITLTDIRSKSTDIGTELSSRQHSANVALLRTLGPRSSVSVGARRIKFDSDIASSYVENAAVFAAAMRF